MTTSTLALREGTELAQTKRQWSIDDMRSVAADIAKSGLFPKVNTMEKAFGLMMLCEADELHPIEAFRRYHLMDEGPSMRADAMLATFHAKGGRVDWIETNQEVCEAEWWHPEIHPKKVNIRLTFERYIENGTAVSSKWDAETRQYLLKKNWRVSSDAMLRARNITAGVRMILPGVVVGIYSPEEHEDFENARTIEITASEHTTTPTTPRSTSIPTRTPSALHRAPQPTAQAEPTAPTEDRVIGQPPGNEDGRTYVQVATEACTEFNRIATAVEHEQRADVRELHRSLVMQAINEGHHKDTPKNIAEAIKVMSTLYRSHRNWVRDKINTMLDPDTIIEGEIIDVEFDTTEDSTEEETQPPPAPEPERTAPPKPTPEPPTKKTATTPPPRPTPALSGMTIDKFIEQQLDSARSDFRQFFPNQVKQASFKVIPAVAIQVQRHVAKFATANNWCEYNAGVTTNDLQLMLENLDETRGTEIRSEIRRYVELKLRRAKEEAAIEKKNSTEPDPEA